METAKAILINLSVPVIGAFFYLRLRLQMRKKQVPNPPEIPMMALFFGYCGLLILLLTALFWRMSGLASVEYILLLIPLPLVILGCIGWLYPLRNVSRYHRYSLIGCVSYIVVMACVWMFLLPDIIKK